MAMPTLRVRQEQNRHRAFLAATDLITGGGVVLLSVVGAFQPKTWPLLVDDGSSLFFLLPMCWVMSLYWHGQYEFDQRWLGLPGLYRNARAVFMGTLLAIAVGYFWIQDMETMRRFFLVAASIATVVFSLERMLAVRIFPRQVLGRRYVVLGKPRAESELVSALMQDQLPRYSEMLGFVVEKDGQASESAEEAEGHTLPVLGTYDQMPELMVECQVSNVAISPDAPRTAGLAHAAARAEAMGATVERLETAYESLTGRAPVLLAGADWGESLESVRTHVYMTRWKRAVDVVVTLLVLPVAAALIGLCGLGVKVFSPGPAFYHQRRVGKDGEEFVFTKLRTMIVDAEKHTGAVWAKKDDPRVTPIGGVLRKLRLDELPQLFSVLRGDMSLVGPRPERPEFVSRFMEEIPFYEKRLLVRPGITGWAQVNHRYDQDIDDVVEKLRYDLYYVRHVNFTLDLQILLRTFWVMIGRKGSQ